MINNDSSTLIIKDGNVIEFECIISFDPQHGKHFRVLRDEMGYEEMIRELIYKGYKQSIKVDNRTINIDEKSTQEIALYKDELIQINSIEELTAFLSARDFECEVIPRDAYALIASVSVDGQDIGYEVINSTNKSKVANFTLNLFKTVVDQVNNIEYEPIINEKAGSYEIEIFDTKEDLVIKKRIRELMESLKAQTIDAQNYLQKGHYYSLINSFLELSLIKYLDIVKVKFSQTSFVEFSKYEIVSLKLKIRELLNALPFTFIVDRHNLPRALDAKNFSFKLDTREGVRYCHAENQEIFESISNVQNETLELSGFYTSIKSVNITNIQRNR